jgi:hypothetical protein
MRLFKSLPALNAATSYRTSWATVTGQHFGKFCRFEFSPNWLSVLDLAFQLYDISCRQIGGNHAGRGNIQIPIAIDLLHVRRRKGQRHLVPVS